MKGFLLTVMFCAAVASCNERQRIADAVANQLELYPEATYQDLYKAFFQAEFGPEHMISDTSSAGRYLDMELQIPDSSEILFEPIGMDSSFFRVHLKAVQSGKITRSQLFDAFIAGSGRIEEEDIRAWTGKWKRIDRVIVSMDPGTEGFLSERNRIDSLLRSGSYAVHHSRTFSERYSPHYRIVRKDLFYRHLHDSLK